MLLVVVVVHVVVLLEQGSLAAAGTGGSCWNRGVLLLVNTRTQCCWCCPEHRCGCPDIPEKWIILRHRQKGGSPLGGSPLGTHQVQVQV